MDLKSTNHLSDGENHFDSEISLLPFFKVIIKKRWFIIGMLFLGIALGYFITYLLYTPRYFAEGAVLLQSPERIKQDTRSGGTGSSPSNVVQYSYDTVLNSRGFIIDIINKRYTYDNNKITSDLKGFYKNNEIEGTIKTVSSNLKISYDKRTFVLKLSYTSPFPDLSAEVVNNVINQLNEFYKNEFYGTTKRNYEFVKGQLSEAKKTLDDSRTNLTKFIKSNKQLQGNADDNNREYAYQGAKAELKSLQDDVLLKEDFYKALMEKSQALGIDSLQSSPLLIILQKAIAPAKPLPPKYIRNAAILGFLFLVFGIVIIIIRNIGEITGQDENIVTLILEELKKDLAKLRIFKK